MPGTVLGTGALNYGRADEKEDKSYTTTLWLTFIFFPVIPIATQRVRNVTRTQYHVLEQLPLNWRQIRRTYLFALLSIFGIVAGMYAFFFGLDLLNAHLTKSK